MSELISFEDAMKELEDRVREINRNDPERLSWEYIDMPDTQVVARA